MILLVALALVTVSVPMTGGRLTWLARMPFRRLELVVVATFIQILVVNVASTVLPAAVSSALHLASYGFVVAFLVANRHIVGLWIVGVGGALNLIAIAANGGVMPARPGALAAAGRAAAVEGFTNSTAVADARLWFLGDIFAWPEPMPLANVFSIGDVALVIGAGVILHVHAGSRLGRTIVERRHDRSEPKPEHPAHLVSGSVAGGEGLRPR